jgi:hypothetical protein
VTSRLVPTVSAHLECVVYAATVGGEPTVTVAVPPEWTRSSETASIREVDDLQDQPDHQLISIQIEGPPGLRAATRSQLLRPGLDLGAPSAQNLTWRCGTAITVASHPPVRGRRSRRCGRVPTARRPTVLSAATKNRGRGGPDRGGQLRTGERAQRTAHGPVRVKHLSNERRRKARFPAESSVRQHLENSRFAGQSRIGTYQPDGRNLAHNPKVAGSNPARLSRNRWKSRAPRDRGFRGYGARSADAAAPRSPNAFERQTCPREQLIVGVVVQNGCVVMLSYSGDSRSIGFDAMERIWVGCELRLRIQ